MNGRIVTVGWLIDGSKLSAYLLDVDHKRGGSKAKYLIGFSPQDPKTLADALVAHAMGNLPGLVKQQLTGPNRVVFEGSVQAPDGRAIPLRTVWETQERGDEQEMRFLTAVPLTR